MTHNKKKKQAVHHLWLSSHENDKQIILIACLQNVQVGSTPCVEIPVWPLVLSQEPLSVKLFPVHYVALHSEVI